ncbi:MAG: carbohydrate ABC transporter permease [Spirochaetes bacterium]|jgi:multiple sugar transport system permease protein|nr:carbohydrate ABC transporter permease [Spirochaetota bacterium]MCX7040703.1 carbohydrate ABC transporter permease [Spirochaetota bacterium]
MHIRRAGVVTYLFLVAGAVVAMFPFLWMILNSFKTNKEILLTVPPTFFPKTFYIGGYLKVLFEAPFLRWTLNSLFIAAVTTTAVVFSSALVGYVYAKFRFFGKKTSFLIILATLMIPFEVIMIPEFLVVSWLGLLNTLSGVMAPSLVSAFGIFMCRQFCESIPGDLMDAGRIDGASELGIFLRIVVPEITPAMSALTIFNFMASWNNYVWPLIVINDVKKMPVSLAISYFNGIHAVHPSYVMAASVLVMLPILIVYLIFQRQFVEGLALSGLK